LDEVISRDLHAGIEEKRDIAIQQSRRVDKVKNHGKSERRFIVGGEKEYHFAIRFPGFALSSI
jgi:hypothetical protein